MPDALPRWNLPDALNPTPPRIFSRTRRISPHHCLTERPVATLWLRQGFCTALEYGLPPTAGWGLGATKPNQRDGMQVDKTGLTISLVRQNCNQRDDMQVDKTG